LHASKQSGQAIPAREVIHEFSHVRLMLLRRTDAGRNDIPELLALPGINHFFQMAIFKLIGLFRSQIFGQDDCLDDGTFHHGLGQFPLKHRADVFQLELARQPLPDFLQDHRSIMCRWRSSRLAKKRTYLLFDSDRCRFGLGSRFLVVVLSGEV
jgi:hypothetical protein